jgi:hypothetical protein
MNKRDGSPQSQRGNAAPQVHRDGVVEVRIHCYINRVGTVVAVTSRLWSGASGPVTRLGHIPIYLSRDDLRGADPIAVVRLCAEGILRGTDPAGAGEPTAHAVGVSAPPEGGRGAA